MQAMEKPAFVLTGIKHCGKSTQGKLLAEHFDCPFFDTDDVIFNMTGKTARENYLIGGKKAFLLAEQDACKQIAKTVKCQNHNQKTVIATGGGICANNEAITVLREIGTIIFLNADEKTAVERITREIKFDSDGKMTNLPAYISEKNPSTIEDVKTIFAEFYSARKKLYEAICDIKIDMKPVPKKENLARILESLLRFKS